MSYPVDFPDGNASDWLVRDAQIMKRGSVAALALLLYDYLITFDDEVAYMWNTPGHGLGKIVYYLNRYLVPLELALDLSGVLAPNPSQEFCVVWYLFEEFGSIFSIAVVEIILMTQTWVLYGGERRMQIVLWGLLGLCLLTSFILIGIGAHEVVVGASQNPGIPGCVAILTARVQFWEFWCPWTFFSLVIFTLTAAKAHMTAKGDVTTPLGVAMIRDGVLYFAVIAAASIVNVVLFMTVPVSLQSLGVPWFQAVASISGSRLLLNMRRVRSETAAQYAPIAPRRRPPPLHRRYSSSQQPLVSEPPSSAETYYEITPLTSRTTSDGSTPSPFADRIQTERRVSFV